MNKKRPKTDQKGLYWTPEYAAWCHMLYRCTNSKSEDFRNYGSRGITVCDRWNPDSGGSFLNFLTDMGRRPSKKRSLDRIDNEQGYSPKNCRWATRKTQNNNRRRFNPHIPLESFQE